MPKTFTPKIPNKYNLTVPKVRKLLVKDRNKISAPLFWRNNVINAWCISESIGSDADREFGTDSSFWIGIYDEDASAYAGKFRISFETYGGMCSYNFTNFYSKKSIKNPQDLRLQERFLEVINHLIDEGILGIPEEK